MLVLGLLAHWAATAAEFAGSPFALGSPRIEGESSTSAFLRQVNTATTMHWLADILISLGWVFVVLTFWHWLRRNVSTD